LGETLKAGGVPVASASTLPYNPPTLDSRRTYVLVATAVFVVAIVTLYPYLGAAGFCGHSDQCPEALQGQGMPATGLGATCVAAVLVTSSAALAIGLQRLRNHRFSDPKPLEIHLSPEPPPPRSYLSF
jgi:hypothetical protein